MKLEEAIKILNELKEKANIEDMDMNDCFNGEHIQAIETVLQEYENSIPKKKIENKIKELEKKKRDLSPFGMGKIEGLYELLER